VQCLARASSQLAWTDHSELARRALLRAEQAAAGHTLTPYTAARLEFARAYDHLVEGVSDASLRSMDTVIDMYTTFGARRDCLQARLMHATIACFYGGYVRTTEGDFQQCIDEAEQLGASYLAHWARFELAALHALRGQREEATRLFALVAAIVTAAPMFVAHRMIVTGWAAIIANDSDELASVLDFARDSPIRARFRASGDAFGAFLRLRRGDRGIAIERARDALARLDREASIPTDFDRCGISAALMVLLETGEPDAQALLEKHRRQLDAILARFTDHEAREVFANELSWNRWIIERTS
jgi:hypothetical protein